MFQTSQIKADRATPVPGPGPRRALTAAEARRILPRRTLPARSPARYRAGGKRVLDLALALAVLPLVLPVVALLWLLVRGTGGPGFFLQERVGRNGRRFACLKLRSMRVGAEAELAGILAADPGRAREWRACQKLTDDPRVTALGAVLRRTSLDELPQVFNVLTGDMSLVGPRPITAGELDRYGAARHAYLSLRPGLTGLWQVSGRSDLTYAERVALDVRYFQALALGLDLALLGRTVIVVLHRTGR